MCLVAFSRTERYSALEKLERSKQQGHRPTWAYMVICDDCSHGCAWCYGGFDGSHQHRMHLHEFVSIIDKLAAAGITQLTLAGGEPTEHPQFPEFLRAASKRGLLIHVASHGEHIGADLAALMGDYGVRQVQLNWQGSLHHDHVHRAPGSFKKATQAIPLMLAAGIEVTANVTVGRYNMPDLKDIFTEASNLGVTRLRVWESTGRGNPHRRGLEAREIFESAQEIARDLGYTHTLSYDPDFGGDITVPCLQFANLYLYITSYGKLEFCGAVEERLHYVDCLDPGLDGDSIIEQYMTLNRTILGDNDPYCPAREGFRPGTQLPPIPGASDNLIARD